MAVKKAYRINVENLVYAVLKTDDTTGLSYGPIKKFSEAMQVQLTPTVASGTLYGDGVKQSTITKLTGITGVFDVTKIPIDVKADISGSKYENGVLIEKASDTAPYIALGYKIPQDEAGVAEYIWLLKGRAQPYANTVQQATDSINYSTDSITIDFVTRENDGAIKHSADSADSTFTDVMAKAWFTKVPGSN